MLTSSINELQDLIGKHFLKLKYLWLVHVNNGFLLFTPGLPLTSLHWLVNFLGLFCISLHEIADVKTKRIWKWKTLLPQNIISLWETKLFESLRLVFQDFLLSPNQMCTKIWKFWFLDSSMTIMINWCNGNPQYFV